jgi:BirA family biotin operon repressor/biotin-[acetyl-CoA-carboxylase] ligase
MTIQCHRSLPSTQDEALRLHLLGRREAVMTLHQTNGRGRLGRVWHSGPGESLSISLVLPEEAGHPMPWLIGMGAAVAVAGAFHLQIQWPNDLGLQRRKVGGVLLELRDGVPVLGIGLNLCVPEFSPSLADRAISLHEVRPNPPGPLAAARRLLERLERWRAPRTWQELQPAWRQFDQTPGKQFKLSDGRVAEALGLGPHGELIASHEGETLSVLAADALWGPRE